MTNTITITKGVPVTLVSLANEDQKRSNSREAQRLYRQTARATKLARKRV